MNSSIKPYYRGEIKRVAEKTVSERGDFVFSIITDTHLDNTLNDSINNIHQVDKIVNFRCLLHLGDFLNGNIPFKYTKKIIKSEMERYRGALRNGVLYPVQGNHDGYTDNIYLNAFDMAIDEDWYNATRFVDEYKNVSRIPQKPYYYVDYPNEKIRFIILSSCHYTFENNKFNKKTGFDDEQVNWLKKYALNIDSDWTVFFCSHIPPYSVFKDDDVKNDNSCINGQLVVDIILLEQKRKNFNIAAWLIGDYHGDFFAKVRGINMIIFACRTAYEPQLWQMPEGGYYPTRLLNTVTEDLWVSAVLDKKQRKLKLYRFGAGEDVILEY